MLMSGHQDKNISEGSFGRCSNKAANLRQSPACNIKKHSYKPILVPHHELLSLNYHHN